MKIITRNFQQFYRFRDNNFKNIKHLQLMLNVVIRWNNSYDMLIRFQKLKHAMIWWIFDVLSWRDVFRLKFKFEKWLQIEYLIQFLQFIKQITKMTFVTRIIFVHQMWFVYDKLFDHLNVQNVKTNNMNFLLWISILKHAIEKKKTN